MQKTVAYRSWLSTSNAAGGGENGGATASGTEEGKSNSEHKRASVRKIVSENAVIVIGRRGCCMSHVVKRLLQGLGVNPAVFDIDEADEKAIVEELARIIGLDDGNNEGRPQFPAVFVGGKLFGGLERVMATHISGELVPILREAGALWL